MVTRDSLLNNGSRGSQSGDRSVAGDRDSRWDTLRNLAVDADASAALIPFVQNSVRRFRSLAPATPRAVMTEPTY